MNRYQIMHALFDTDSWKNSDFHIFLIGEKDADRRRDVNN